MDNFWFALGLTAFAGLSTGIGSAIAFFAKRTNYRFLSVATGFSAGVMLYVSFVEILPKAAESLGVSNGESGGNWWATVAFFGGIVLILVIDRLIPSSENPHEVRTGGQIEAVHEGASPQAFLHTTPAKLHRMGLFTALAIAIHNFPEGLATFMAALQDPALGIAIAVAIAIHNIPEGIAVAVPIYYATGSRRKAFVYSFLSGLSEPVGAVIGYLILLPFMSDLLFGILFALVAGIMVYISLDELLPSAREYGEHHYSIGGLIAGMLVMAVSLVLFM